MLRYWLDEQIRDHVDGYPHSNTLRRGIYQRRCIACQVIAEKLSKEHPETTIADMMKHELIRNYGGGVHQADEVVMRWLRAVAPAEVSAKRGRPRKDKATDET